MREILDKYPQLESRQLYDKATRMDPELHRLNLRSFHARYVLPIRRERARAEGRIRRRTKPAPQPKAAATRPAAAVQAPAAAAATDGARERVRQILLRYTRELVAADSRVALVDLVAGMDGVVGEVLQAVQQAPGRS